MTNQTAKFSRIVALVGGAFLGSGGLVAMVAPRTFFDTIATFHPYNRHFVQDIGAFNIGFAAVLLIAALVRRADALGSALIGVGIGTAAHTLSHIVGHDLGGQPAIDIPIFTLVSALLLVAGLLRLRTTTG